ncbi:hypothetical protein [Nitratireductor luteus]|uniref:hypothetical protein n=1 Tax=Nitratireductor luteus TaxID=2976980 RepID=UPI00224025FD|nr:hypothetical protein [Nitratireductor luteus]
MDDSDDTTTLPSVTRRTLLTGTIATTATLPLSTAGAAAGALGGKPAFDPALALWNEWKAAYRRALAACRKQQCLESRLINRVGFPCAEVFLPDEDVTVTVHDPEQIEELFGDDPFWVGTRAKAEADLAAYQARWDAADEELGYSAAKQAEQDAADHEQDLFDALTHTPATSLAGIAGKLDAVLREGESWEDCSDFPWPQIRSALVDLVRLGQAMQPGTFIPGSDRDGPYLRRHRDGCCFQVGKGPSGSRS